VKPLRQNPDILPASISCLVLPLTDRKLLVPNTAVAEVLLSSEEPQRIDHALCYGWITWRDQRLPLISLEVVLGSHRPVLGDSYRIAVFNTIGPRAEKGFFAVRLGAIPQSIQVTQSGVFEEATASRLLMAAVVDNERLWVPNLELVEAEIAALPS